MSDASRTPPRVNRRASRRAALRGTIKVECRKGAPGLGPNLTQQALDVSETGVRLVLKVDLKRGQEVEVLIQGGGYGRPVKRAAHVIWSLPTENNCYCVGLQFDGYLPYAELQNLTKPPRTLS